MAKVHRQIRDVLLAHRIEKFLQEAGVVGDKARITYTGDIIYPQAHVTERGRGYIFSREDSLLPDPFAVLDRYAHALGNPLPLWSCVNNHTRYFGHIGYHMYFAKKRFTINLVDQTTGQRIVPIWAYTPCLSYDIRAEYKRNSAEISQYFVLPMNTYTRTFGVVPLVVKVTVETISSVLGIELKGMRETEKGAVKWLWSSAPNHERLHAHRWKIYGQNQRYKGYDTTYPFEYIGESDD